MARIEQLELSYNGDESIKWHNYLDKLLEFLTKLNPHLSHDSAIPLLGNQNKCPLEMFKNVHSSFIHNSSKLQTTPISINREMDKQIVLRSYNGILLSNKKK